LKVQQGRISLVGIKIEGEHRPLEARVETAAAAAAAAAAERREGEIVATKER